MARPIKEVPILKSKDVECFKYNLEHPTTVSAEEVTKARETYEAFFAEMQGRPLCFYSPLETNRMIIV